MKTIVPTKQCFVSLMLLILFTASGLLSQAQSGSQTSPELSFINPTLYSGTAGQDNAVYRFKSVNSSLDALVKISGRSSSLVKLDDIDLTSTGFNKAFQPQVSYNNGSTNIAASWWMEFEISFVNKNTTTPAIINMFKVTALDIDGDNNRLREWDAFYGPSSYSMENNSLLQVSNLTQTILNVVQTVGKTFTGVITQYSGIDTAQTSIMTTLTYNNTNSIKFRAGATTTGSASVTERMYATWFRDFTYNSAIVTTLPVSLISFTAALNSGKADLKWTTASEINVSHFVVEKSYDGKDFSDAGLVFAYGNSSEKKNYSLSDNNINIQQGVVYYRLRSVDMDGKEQLSDVRIIRIAKQGEMLKLTAYPNPVNNELRITLPSTWQGKAVVLEIINQNGQSMKMIKAGIASQTETVMVNDLVRGLYMIKASCGDESSTQKVIKN